ncbi:uncharacterized protein LOC107367031 [Tetranychus urticae]|uniref:uncharacterized protein LOC107367031 n=1 Tax=Tetranychus urticae TaxID=32264 RepID=UPI00077BCE5F|nr:uncharacterized protein LOC107367031 [Tetranychus urticae]
MAKYLIFVLFTLCSTILAAPFDWEVDYEPIGPEYTYKIGVEVGEMESTVGPSRVFVTLYKKVGEHEWDGDGSHEAGVNIIFESHSTQNFTVKSSTPFSQVDKIFFQFSGMQVYYGYSAIHFVNIQTAYVTETTPNQPQITKKYCKNVSGKLDDSVASRSLSLC